MADYIEQVWVVSGTKFGSEAGKNMLVRKALLWIEEILCSVQGVVIKDYGCIGLLAELCRTQLMVTTSS